jgi:Zn-dependent protease
VHIDPIGTLLFPLIQIFTNVPLLGWAKPTPYNPADFRRDVTMRKGHMLVAAAGPVSNFLLALIFTGILRHRQQPLGEDEVDTRGRPLPASSTTRLNRSAAGFAAA